MINDLGEIWLSPHQLLTRRLPGLSYIAHISDAL